MDVWRDFRETFPNIESNFGGYSLIEEAVAWADKWPDEVWTQKVSDSLATSSLLVFIKLPIPYLPRTVIELVILPQNANKPTLITISRPEEIVGILFAMRIEQIDRSILPYIPRKRSKSLCKRLLSKMWMLCHRDRRK